MVVKYLLAFWIFSMLFQNYPVYGSLSIDNILAPVLLFLSIFVSKVRNKFFFFLVVLLFCGVHFPEICKSTDNYELFYGSALQFFKYLMYFVIPILLLSESKSYETINSATAICSFVAGVSVFFAALGIIDFDVKRFEASRLAIDWLPKSIGLVSTYGELAIYFVMSLLVIIGVKRNRLGPKWLQGRGGRALVLVGISAGVISAQSRNVVLSVVLAYVLFYIVSVWFDAKKGKTFFVKFFFVSSLVFSAVAFIYIFNDIVLFLKNIGGQGAVGTASDRLNQYSFGLQVVLEYPCFGAPSNVLTSYGDYFRRIHNLWVSLAASGGVFSCLMMFGLMLVNFATLFVLCTKEGVAQQARIFLVLLTVIFFSANFYPASGSYVFWQYLGVISSLSVSWKPFKD